MTNNKQKRNFKYRMMFSAWPGIISKNLSSKLPLVFLDLTKHLNPLLKFSQKYTISKESN